MGKKLKFMLLTLLGFSAACSTVRNGTDNGGKTLPESAGEAPEVQVDTIRAIRLLYGVRRPRPVPENKADSLVQNGAAAADTPAASDVPAAPDAPAKADTPEASR